jgi:Fe2+ transport protein
MDAETSPRIELLLQLQRGSAGGRSGRQRCTHVLMVRATLIDADGNEVGTHRQPFLWRPWLYHYGRNRTVPGDGDYTLRVRVEPPEFPRHDKTNGRRFVEPVEVEFRDVAIKTGRKIS